MKTMIKQIRSVIVDVPIKRPHQFSTEIVSTKSFVVIQVELENGLIGIGEGTTPGIWWNGESVETMQLVIERYLKPLLINQDPRNIEQLLQLFDRHVRANPFAKATVEMALFDVVGKIYNAPVHQLLGGLFQEAIDVKWALATGDADGDIAEAKELVSSKQYRDFKIKAGKYQPIDDAKRAIKIAEGLNGISTIGIDPNGSWDKLTAVRWMERLNDAGVDFLEQPLSPLDFEGAAKLVSMKKVPVMADESVATIQDAQRLVQEKAADIFSLKIHKSGGMRNTLKIAAIAESAGLVCFGGTSLESSIGSAASIHAFGTIRNLTYGCESFGPPWLADDLVKNPLKFKEGKVIIPSGAGLGVELDEMKIEKYRRKKERVTNGVF
ncbi:MULTISPECIES: muconate/chloromuconate family cycloisomerase [unclassified Sporosarcina]|uniref:muconate/chloromuconate family cycloisomerase n=1 Tax=unclassified Sporosarcina TaxID=2647733 RepID=UPI000C16E363|nr:MULTISPECIES: muconate/chloromuconate family cycloisomerase [unclassified Sporosarcina]PID04618.1 chloromuconate cycloisomerase [Sporosarcina sp. P30]PID07797.1 chloromuconate cycloisomerase [Sporosarcina sp. P31]PID10958.1 chloromuconate cycloisomerase [Sporosarcina sp. P32b]